MEPLGVDPGLEAPAVPGVRFPGHALRPAFVELRELLPHLADEGVHAGAELVRALPGLRVSLGQSLPVPRRLSGERLELRGDHYSDKHLPLNTV